MKKNNRTWLWGLAAVGAFGAWHWLDVRVSALASGDGWLMGGYLRLVTAAVGTVGVLGRLLLGEETGRSPGKPRFSLEHLYLAAGLSLGALYLLVLPPLSAPDEISHYISAYQLSSRLLGQPSNSRSGHVLVRAEDIWLEDVGDMYEYEAGEDGYLRVKEGSSENAWVLGNILTEDTYAQIREQGLTGRRYPAAAGSGEEDRLLVSIYPPVVTTPAGYLPQAAGIALARLLRLNSVGLLYLGRLWNLLFFTAMVFFSIRRLPFGKEVMFGVALLPMTLHLSASLSYDVMIMGCMFYLTSVCLDLAYEKEQVSRRDVAVLAILMAAAGPCKLVYTALMGLCLLIPVKKFGNWKRWALSAAAVGLAWGLAMAAINTRIILTYATETESYVSWAQETGYSLTYLIHSPLRLARMFYQTVLWQAEHYHLTMIGAYLGNLDQVLDVPYVLVVFFTGSLLCLAMKKPGESQRMSLGNRAWVWAVCGGCCLAILLSMLIAWTTISSPVISGVQGRYFLPFLPVLLITLKNDVIVLTKNGNRSILYLMCCANGYVLLRLYSIVSMRL